jgi:hypothetical protein
MAIKPVLASVFVSMGLLGAASSAQAAPILQYASSVIGFSSQYSTTSWSAAQVLGAPNTMGYGDIATSWAPRSQNGTLEWISVGFNTAVYANGATIRETYGNGFVYQVDAIDTLGNLHTVWQGTDTSLPGAPVNFGVSWNTTSYLVAGLKVYVNTNHSGAWEEIDSIQLAGMSDRPLPEPATFAMMLAGLGLVGFTRRRVC